MKYRRQCSGWVPKKNLAAGPKGKGFSMFLDMPSDQGGS